MAEFAEEDLLHQYLYPCFGERMGWHYCDDCRPHLENVAIPATFERRGILPPQLLQPLLEPFHFERRSLSNPASNGVYSCSLDVISPHFVLREDGSIGIFVTWTANGSILRKLVDLERVLVCSRDRWPDAAAFLTELQLKRPSKYVKADYLKRWQQGIEAAFQASKSMTS